MGKVVLRTAAVAAVLFTIGTAQASAQDYGGGRLPTAAQPTKGYYPTMGVSLQVRGSQIAVRFDTTVRCGSIGYDAVGRKVVPFDGTNFTASGESSFLVGTNGRNFVVYKWTMSGTVDAVGARGTLRIVGQRKLVGKRRTECSRKPSRTWSARVLTPTAPGGAPPAGRAGFGGLSDLELSGDLRAPVILRVSKNARKVAARWTITAGCRNRKSRQDLVNFTPPTAVKADGTFVRRERFSVSYADAFIKYRVSFGGRFSGDGASGTLRMRAREFSPDGKRFRRRCDSGVRTWSAARLP
jgi:hypothetical protein